MKLKTVQTASNKHSAYVSCIGWTSDNEVFSIADDKSILRWSGDGELLGAVGIFEPKGSDGNSTVYATDMKWFPPPPGKGQSVSDTYVVGGTDGKFYICYKSGKVEKAIEAHTGAVLCLRWNYEGSALVSGGEDGVIKIWSRTGMLRSTLIKSNCPIYSVAWSSNNEQCLYTNGKNLVIKSLQPGNKPFQWKAHDGLILKVDWSLVNGLIVSCGEDKRYKVWDNFGRKIFSSSPFEHPVTSISWSPSGDMFSIGSYNLVGVCDKMGWCYALETPKSGSIFEITWSPDGTQVACAGGSGAVVFGHLLNRTYEWKQYQITVLDDHKVLVNNVQGSTENLEFRDRVIKVCMGFNYLVITTAFQCYIYSEKNWNTPIIVDLKNSGRVTCIQQCVEYFVLVDNFLGIQVFSYDGKLVSQPKYPGLRGEFITDQTVSVSSDTLAVRDNNDEKSMFLVVNMRLTLLKCVDVYLFDVKTGKMIGEGPLKHSMEIAEISLNKQNLGNGRLLALVDKNRDLFLTKIAKLSLHKLGAIIEAFAWNDENDLLVTIMDTKFVVWYYPTAIFIDEEVAPLAKHERDGSSFGRNVQITNFSGTHCILRRADGALVHVSNISPYAGMLQEFSKKKQWEQAIRLCRHIKIKELWAALAAMSLASQDLNTAEVAYAAIDEIHKVEYVCFIRDIPSAEGRAAELALMRKQPKEAEGILLSANLIYRCIRMWIDLYNWERALELAVKYKTHVDTVLYFRAKYLSALGRVEDNKRFLPYVESVPVDWIKVKSKISMELEAEKSGKPAAIRA